MIREGRCRINWPDWLARPRSSTRAPAGKACGLKRSLNGNAWLLPAILLLGAAWAALVLWLNPSFLWWLVPIVGSLMGLYLPESQQFRNVQGEAPIGVVQGLFREGAARTLQRNQSRRSHG